MYNMESFALSDMTRCGIDLRRMGSGTGSMEETAQKIADYFYRTLRREGGLPACALVRMYVTAPYAETGWASDG